MDEEHLSISCSSAGCFLTCPRRYFYEYIMRLSPREEYHYFLWGKLVHAYANYVDMGVTEHEDIMKELEQGECAELAKTCDASLKALFLAHRFKYREEDEHYITLASEVKFKYDLTYDTSFVGRVDRIVEDKRTGKRYVWERKTASQTSTTFWKYIEMNPQTRGYPFAVERTLGLQVDGIIYDVLKKPALHKNALETEEALQERVAYAYLARPEEYLIRKVFPLTQEQIDSFEWWLMGVRSSLKEAMRSGWWVPHHPPIWYPCPFERICPDNDVCISNSFVSRPREEFHKELV